MTTVFIRSQTIRPVQPATGPAKPVVGLITTIVIRVTTLMKELVLEMSVPAMIGFSTMPRTPHVLPVIIRV